MAVVKKARKEWKEAKSTHKQHKNAGTKALVDKKKKALDRLEEQLTKLQVNLTDKVGPVCVFQVALLRPHPHTMRARKFEHNPLMLLACSVDNPIHDSRFHLLACGLCLS